MHDATVKITNWPCSLNTVMNWHT